MSDKRVDNERYHAIEVHVLTRRSAIGPGKKKKKERKKNRMGAARTASKSQGRVYFYIRLCMFDIGLSKRQQ